MTEIKNIGGYLLLDSQGNIIPSASLTKIQPQWKPLIEKTVDAYKEHYGSALVSVYVRGSVAKGEAIDDISDLDTIAVVDLEEKSISTNWGKVFSDELVGSYPFVEKIEIMAETREQAIDTNRATHILLKTQAICVYGEDIAQTIAAIKLGEAAQHYRSIQSDIEKSIRFFEGDNDLQFKKQCAWIMKRILRTGFELVMERAQKYTRDLYPCYESFSFYYPEKSTLMRKTLDLVLNPSQHPEIVLPILYAWREWMPEEVKKFFGKKRESFQKREQVS